MTLDHTTVQWTAAGLFGLALLHTFSTSFFAKLSHNSKHHSGFWHLMAEVEVVFGFWAFVLIGALAVLMGTSPAVEYLESRNYTEPLFVFVIMVVAASRPILVTVQRMVQRLAQAMPTGETVGVYWLCLCAVPLFGSLITEPAAMTLAALMPRVTVPVAARRSVLGVRRWSAP